jgi:hypothetical protein
MSDYTAPPWYLGKKSLSVLLFGDSNALGSGGTDPNGGQTANSSVYCYASESGQTPYSVANLGMRTLDPNGTYRVAEYGSAAGQADGIYIGQLLGGNGNPGMQACDTIQSATTLPTYLTGIYKPGTTTDFWASGAGWDAIETHFAAALAATPQSRSYADVILCSSGGANCLNGQSAEDWYSEWYLMRQNLIDAGFWDRQHTQYIHFEFPTNGSIPQYDAGWQGLNYMLTRTDERTALISSADMTYNSELPVHFLPPSYTAMGASAGELSISGVNPPSVGRSVVDRENRVFFVNG